MNHSNPLPFVHSSATFSTDGNLTDRSVTTDDAVSGLPSGYLAAYRAFAESERMDLILDSLSLRCSVAQDLAGTVRPVWFYLAAMSLVATLGVAVFAEFSLPQLAAMRADLVLVPAAPVDENWLTVPNVGWLMVALRLLSLELILLGFSTRGSALIAGWLGGIRLADEIAFAQQESDILRNSLALEIFLVLSEKSLVDQTGCNRRSAGWIWHLAESG